MIRWFLIFLLCGCLTPALTASIVDLPDTCDDQYDLSWRMSFGKQTSAWQLDFTAGKGQPGYQLRISATGASWQQIGIPQPQAPVSAKLALTTGTPYQVTFKRRPDTVALLIDHRLVLCAPAPSGDNEKVRLPGQIPGITVTEARYHKIEPRMFGDDFMRPEAPNPLLRSWVEDPTWQVAYFRKDHPGTDPTDPKTKMAMLNPWRLSLFQVTASSTNGFWYLYTGIGPSWVIANANMVGENWDRYFVEAAVRPEYDSTVGLIAAYQNNKNYLLFRWKAREYVEKNVQPRAQLVAVVGGKEQVLAESTRGFDPGQWYKLRLNLSWQRIEALIDGKVLLAANNPGPCEGQIGLYASGVEHPRKPKLDEATASMYLATDEKTGKTYNDAADAMRVTSCIYFDDVRVGDWVGIDSLSASPYAKETSGKWMTTGAVLQAQAVGKIVTGSDTLSQYTVTSQVKIPQNGGAGLYIHLNAAQTGYIWTLNGKEQRLHPITNGKWETPIDTASLGVPPNSWAELRVEADGPYIACYYNDRRVLEAYDPQRTAGRCGVYAGSSGVQYTGFSLTPLERALQKVQVHKGFDQDAWMVTWSGAEADWYPAINHGAYVYLTARSGRPVGPGAAGPGPAGPLMTNVPGLYWHKGGHYHDLRVTIPVSARTLDGQTLHLATNYAEKSGYRLQLSQRQGSGLATLWREEKTVGAYPFALGDHTRIVVERRGSLLLATVQEIDPEDAADDPEVLSEKTLLTYRDARPLRAEMVGFTVTNPALSAATVVVESNRLQDTFEQSPVSWTAQNGVWAVMARYSCQPQWNWYGGFGSGTPTIWNKTRLDGDQNVEVYMGIKMKYDNMTEGEMQRFRDMNVSICTDGAHLNSGYTLIRAGRQDNKPVTLLLRKGVIVRSSTLPADLIPGGGHRQWFAIRLEKRGGEIKVFIDNRLAIAYTDPDPLPGGYAAFWTLDNGIMIGRANLSAERMTPGTPQAAAPLVVQEELAPLPSSPVTVNGKAYPLATFESGFDGWRQRPGLSGALVRERVTGANGKPNTYLKVVNTYPAGDLSVTVSATPVNLSVTPVFTCDYIFDKGAQVNLYVRHQNTWYEFLLTGQQAGEAIRPAGRIPLLADGSKHHLEADLGKMLAEAIRQATGTVPAELIVQEVVIADWSTPANLRRYGFGVNPGGVALRFDNAGFLPRNR